VRRWLLGALAVVLTLIGVGAYLATRTSSPAMARSTAVSETAAATWGEGRQRAPAFALRDQNGAAVSLAALHGRPVIVTFIDPLCRDYCPIEAQHLSDVVRALPPAQKPAIVAVSVNVFGNVRSNLLLDERKWNLVPQWRWAVGSPSALGSVWKAYHIAVIASTKTVTGVKVHTIVHTEAAYLIDANGFQRALFLWPYSAGAVARSLRALTS
jgi:cytochrome oxidase Cu insertion factor (SCO1/SenC/PrrC family)